MEYTSHQQRKIERSQHHNIMLRGIDNIIKYSYIHPERGENCQSHKTLLWIWIMSRSDRLDLETLGFWLNMVKNLPGHCSWSDYWNTTNQKKFVMNINIVNTIYQATTKLGRLKSLCVWNIGWSRSSGSNIGTDSAYSAQKSWEVRAGKKQN